MSSHRHQYNRDFKVSAVRLLAESDKSLSEVARSLGIHETMLRKWRNQLQQRGPESFDESGRQERSLVQQLQRENQQLRRDLVALKKTLGVLERDRR